MTHKDIYEKFMIEYDKENVTTSYPSLTEYEIATLLDKAYLALIAQKFTGNNTRKVPFEGDEKAVEDLQPLIRTTTSNVLSDTTQLGYFIYPLQSDVLYIISIMFTNTDGTKLSSKQIHSTDMYKFTKSVNNNPWSKQLMYCIQNKQIIVAKDTLDYSIRVSAVEAIGAIYTYIKSPEKFVDKNKLISQQDTIQFELSDTMAEELINLALIMATEVVESPRLQTKAQLKGLES